MIFSMFNFWFYYCFINYIDCVIKNGDILYVFVNDYLYIYDIGINLIVVEWKLNSVNNLFKLINYILYFYEVDVCVKVDL